MVWRDSAEEGQFQRGGGSKDRMNKMWGACRSRSLQRSSKSVLCILARARRSLGLNLSSLGVVECMDRYNYLGRNKIY